MPRPLSLPGTLADHARAGRVFAGRELLRRQREHTAERLATTVKGLDALLDGGLAQGATLELIGRASSGRFSLLLAMLAAVTGRGENAVLVDRGSALDPQTAEAAGIDLPRLLWVRPRDMRETLASAEIVLGIGMPLVVVDLGLPPLEGGRGNQAAWLRLARAARRAHTALVIAAPYRVSGAAADTVVQMHSSRARWHAGRRYALPLLHGLDAHLTCTKRAPGPRQAGPRQAGPRQVGLEARDALRLTVWEAIQTSALPGAIDHPAAAAGAGPGVDRHRTQGPTPVLPHAAA